MIGSFKIGIDGRGLADRPAGISRYVTELCRALDEVMPEGQFYVYSLKPVLMPMPSKQWIIRGEHSVVARRLFAASKTTLPWFRYRVGALCKSDGVEVFWGTQSQLPRLAANVKTLITVYDLNLLFARRTMRWRSIIGQQLLYNRSLAEANARCSISVGTAVRLRDLLGYQTDAVIRPSVSSHFSPRSSQEISVCLRRYGINRPYLMALGTWEPRKNLGLLIKTFVRMKGERLLADYSLVLVGARGWRDMKLAATVRKAAESKVVPLGYVPDADLPALYSGCAAFVFPSIYEGFGIPVLEARACGARVVASDSPEIREAGGDDTIYVLPTADGLRDGLTRACQDPKTSARLPLESNTWRESAQELAQLLLKLRSKRDVSSSNDDVEAI